MIKNMKHMKHMRKITTNIISVVVLVLASMFSATIYAASDVGVYELVEVYEYQELDENEISGILLMREEEKLARDVYYELYDIWEQKIFQNIGNSEQQHMDTMFKLIKKYYLEEKYGKY